MKIMSSDKAKTEKKKIALDQDTYDKLKTFSRFHGVKPRLLIDAMLDVVQADEALGKRVIDLTVERGVQAAE